MLLGERKLERKRHYRLRGLIRDDKTSVVERLSRFHQLTKDVAGGAHSLISNLFKVLKLMPSSSGIVPESSFTWKKYLAMFVSSRRLNANMRTEFTAGNLYVSPV